MPREAYVDNAARYAARRDAEAHRSLMLSRLRLATFLPGAAGVVWILSGHESSAVLFGAIALLTAFAVLVVWHARVDDRLAWYEALRLVNVQSVARLARDWSILPAGEIPSRPDINAHPYAPDLDLFGRASMFQWLGPAATVMGAETLAQWLLKPDPPQEVRLRQEAVGVLAPDHAWREVWSARGIVTHSVRQVDIERFLAWVEGGDVFGSRMRLLRAAVLLLTTAIWILIALHATGVASSALWLIPVVVGTILSFALAPAVQHVFDRSGGGQHALGRYASFFEDATRAPAASALMQSLRERLSAGGIPAHECMRRLNRLVGFGELRRGAAIFHFFIQALTLWDFHVLFALERWRRQAGLRVRGWLMALGELDALNALARCAYDNPSWCVPHIGVEPLFDAVALGHPLIPDDRRVPNDVQIGPPGTLLLVTGSNMSGKSTLLRAIGLNVVLAQAGGRACAARLRMPETDLHTCMRIQDSLELGLSYFMAALARLKSVVDAAEHERPGRVLMFLLDEILQGTNSVERGLAVRAVARHLLEAGAIGAMTTHDLSIAGEEPLRSAARLVHFTETVSDRGEMAFDYRLRPGLATSRNALRLMQLIGIDV